MEDLAQTGVISGKNSQTKTDISICDILHCFKMTNVVEMFENFWKRQLVNQNYRGILFRNSLTLYRVVWQQFIGEVGTGEVWMSYRLQKILKSINFHGII